MTGSGTGQGPLASECGMLLYNLQGNKVKGGQTDFPPLYFTEYSNWQPPRCSLHQKNCEIVTCSNITSQHVARGFK
jgi:hypothetical protein